MSIKNEKQPLSVTHPDLAKEAIGWDPKEVTAGQGLRLKWKCLAGHIWDAQVSSRTHFHLGCPICSNQRVVAGINDLATQNKELAEQAFGWDPTTLTAGSNKKVEWKCSLGHTWKAIVANRTKGSNCPYCANQRILIGFNDLKTTHPHLAQEAFGWDPTMVISASNKSLEWKCPLGHIYRTSISERKAGAGCSFCSGRNVLKGFNDMQTLLPELAAEAVGWDPSTVTIGVNKRLLWKCDKGHTYYQTPSRRRAGSGCSYCSNRLVLAGYNDLKTTHPQLAEQALDWDPTKITAGSEKRLMWKCPFGHIWKMRVADRKGGDGCVFCSGHKVLSGFNDLGTTHPDIAKEAFGWNPTSVNAGSNRKVEWKCSLGHTWKAIVANRTLRNDGCVYCSNKLVLPGFNDLATTHPELSREADGWDPSRYTAGQGLKLRWKCAEGHSWSATLGSRSNIGSGCPTCSKFGFDPNKKGFLYFIWHPDWDMFQIGITNDTKTRLNQHHNLGWEIVEIRGPMDGHLTQQWETAMLRMLKAKGADLSNAKIAGKFDGYSEAWSKSTFEVKSIKELMMLTEEFEEK